MQKKVPESEHVLSLGVINGFFHKTFLCSQRMGCLVILTSKANSRCYCIKRLICMHYLLRERSNCLHVSVHCDNWDKDVNEHKNAKKKKKLRPTTSNLSRIQTDTIKDTFYWRKTEQNRFVYTESKRMFLNWHYGPRSSSQWEHKIRFGLPTRLHRHKSKYINWLQYLN